MRDIELGSYYFKHIAEDHKRRAKLTYPGRMIEVREILYPHTQSKRPTFHVILIAKEENANGHTQ